MSEKDMPSESTRSTTAASLACFDGLGRALELLRRERGLGQEELGTRAGVSSSLVSRCEGEVVVPRLDSLDRILAAMDVSLEELSAKLRHVQALRRGQGSRERPPWPAVSVPISPPEGAEQPYYLLVPLPRSGLTNEALEVQLVLHFINRAVEEIRETIRDRGRDAGGRPQPEAGDEEASGQAPKKRAAKRSRRTKGGA